MSPSSTPPPNNSPATARNIRNIGHSLHGSNHAEITLANLPTFTTPQEIEELNKLIARMKKMFLDYAKMNGPFVFTPPVNMSKTTLLSPRSPRAESTFSFATASYSNAVPGTTSRDSGIARVAAQEAVNACYKEVPEFFFRHDFSLEAADTFANALVPVNHVKQECLSRYLDHVETALLKQIWVRSGAFFRALDDIKGLRGLVSDTISHVNDLKNRIRSLDDNLTVSALRIPQLERRRVNEIALQSKLSSMQKVIEAKQTVRMLLEVDDYVGALQVIDDARNVYSVELSRLNSMIRMGQELDEYHSLIGEVMSGKFVSVAIQWDDDDGGFDLESDDNISRFLDGATSRNSNSTVDDRAEHDSVGKSKLSQRQIQLNDQLQDLMHSLVVTGRLQSSLGMYESRLCDSIRLIIRTCVLEYISNFDPLVSAEIVQATSSADSDQASDAILSQRVRDMSCENFIACITMVFEHVVLALKRSFRVHTFMKGSLSQGITGPQQILHVTSHDEADQSPTPKKANKYVTSTETARNGGGIDLIASNIHVQSPKIKDTDSLVNASKKCLVNAGNLAQKSIQQLFTLRKDGNSKMQTDQMRTFWQACLKFISEIESFDNLSTYVLRQALKIQAKDFLDHFHVTNKRKLSNVLQNEKWAQIDVTPDRQAAIDKLISGKSFLPGTATLTDSGAASSGPAASSALNGSTAKKKDNRPVVIDGQNYKIVYSGLVLIDLTLQCLDIAASFSAVASDVIEKIVDLHNFFDDSTQKLVLGAGAINSNTNLKSISAKHLALTAQTIHLIIMLLPHVRAALTVLVSQANQIWLTGLDRTSSTLREHHDLIVGKFVSIVGDSVDSSAQKLRNVDWDRFQGQCEYFDEVGKNVATLHRVLIEVLPPELMQEVFSRIFNSLSRKMPSHFDDIMPATETGKQRILDEVTHIVSGFSRLKLVDCTGPMSLLDDTFRRRYGR
jgi:vacuolar protein sorting-associated protein 54